MSDKLKIPASCGDWAGWAKFGTRNGVPCPPPGYPHPFIERTVQDTAKETGIDCNHVAFSMLAQWLLAGEFETHVRYSLLLTRGVIDLWEEKCFLAEHDEPGTFQTRLEELFEANLRQNPDLITVYKWARAKVTARSRSAINLLDICLHPADRGR